MEQLDVVVIHAFVYGCIAVLITAAGSLVWVAFKHLDDLR